MRGKDRKDLAVRPALGDTYFDRMFRKFWDVDDWFVFPKRSVSKLTDDDTNVYLAIDIPGFDKSEIKVSLDNRILHIYAKREKENDLRESSYSYLLADTVDIKTAKATYENGVLKLTLPKIKDADVKNTIAIE